MKRSSKRERKRKRKFIIIAKNLPFEIGIREIRNGEPARKFTREICSTSLMNERMMHNWYRSLIMLQSFSRGTRYVGTTRKENTIANTAARVSPFPVIWGVTRRVSAIGILDRRATSCKRAGRSPAASAAPVTRNSRTSFSTLGTTVAERRNAPSAGKPFFTVAACANTVNAPHATFKPVKSNWVTLDEEWSREMGRNLSFQKKNKKRTKTRSYFFLFTSL